MLCNAAVYLVERVYRHFDSGYVAGNLYVPDDSLLYCPPAHVRPSDELNSRNLPGIRFEPATFTPRDLPGMAVDPKLEGRATEGVRYRVTDPATFEPVATGVHVLHAFYHQAPPSERDDFIDRPDWLAKLSGTSDLYDMLSDGASPEHILSAWQSDVATFRRNRTNYLLYE